MHKSNLVIFDFCGTLIEFQTADRYVQFCVRQLPSNRLVQCRHRLIMLMDALRIFKIYNRLKPSNNWRKRVVLWQLKGLSRSLCDQLAREYFEQELRPGIVKPLADKLQEHLANKDRVCILSGGYDIYIRYVAELYGIKEIISSKIAFSNDVCLGKMEGPDCMRENKIAYFNQLPRKKSERVIFYTDSPSDLPLLALVDEPIVVSKHKPQQWAKERNYNQLVWN